MVPRVTAALTAVGEALADRLGSYKQHQRQELDFVRILLRDLLPPVRQAVDTGVAFPARAVLHLYLCSKRWTGLWDGTGPNSELWRAMATSMPAEAAGQALPLMVGWDVVFDCLNGPRIAGDMEDAQVAGRLRATFELNDPMAIRHTASWRGRTNRPMLALWLIAIHLAAHYQAGIDAPFAEIEGSLRQTIAGTRNAVLNANDALFSLIADMPALDAFFALPAHDPVERRLQEERQVKALCPFSAAVIQSLTARLEDMTEFIDQVIDDLEEEYQHRQDLYELIERLRLDYQNASDSRQTLQEFLVLTPSLPC
ncbi:hypothetical protein OC844_004444 [Tilletia horrida]|nr:hypothetical protein OC844_004444 [Tilletia horrida]